KQDGVEFVWNAAPIGVLADSGYTRAIGLQCEKTDDSLNVFNIDCDMVIKAIGQQKMTPFFTKVAGVATHDNGRVTVNELMQTSDPKASAGSDGVSGGGEAVEAAQMGKLAAQGIHFVLTDTIVEFSGSRPQVDG